MILFVFVLGTVVSLVFGHVCTPRSKKGASIAQQPVTISNPSNSSCFPGMGSPFTMPETIPSSLAGWWCDYNTEYAFVGFGYDVTACKFFFSGSKSVFLYLMMFHRFLFCRPEFDDIENGLFEYQKHVQWKIRTNVWSL